MKRFALLAALALTFVAANSQACDGDKKHEDKGKTPQAQTEVPAGPVATTQTGK